MKQETKEISGEVQNIRKDRKAIEIEDVWYQSNFNPVKDNIIKGDIVLVKYTEKGEFKNVKSIEKLPNATQIAKNEKSNLDNEKPAEKLRDSTTINNLVIVSANLYLSPNNKKSLKDVTTDVIASYKQIVNNISK